MLPEWDAWDRDEDGELSEKGLADYEAMMQSAFEDEPYRSYRTDVYDLREEL